MNNLPENGHALRPIVTSIPLPAGFEPTWAGPLAGHAFCIGSEDGRILFTNEIGKPMFGPTKASESGEAVNGVAMSGMWLATATRADVCFSPLARSEKGERESLVLPLGTHGIDATASGFFIAPLGQAGIMVASPPFTADGFITAYEPGKEGFYSYRAGCLRGANQTEVLITAGRLGGIGFTKFVGSDRQLVMTTATLEALDVVDFCPLFPGTESFALAVLGRDRRLLFIKDALTDKKPATFEFKTIEGVAYRVLSCRGDVYVATSKGLYMAANLATDFMNSRIGETINTQVLVMPMEIVDANLCGDEWLLAVTPDGVRRFDVHALHDSQPDDTQGAILRRVAESHAATSSKTLKFDEVMQNSSELALAG